MAAKNNLSRFKKNVQICSDWAKIMKRFDKLPKPISRRDEEGDLFDPGWIFRGHKSESYSLAPLIERDYPHDNWAEVEYRILKEFKSKARMHLHPAQIPRTERELGWLAVMQHYGTPTRLLDFTDSPYVALYFALRNREKNKFPYAEVWAIDAAALRRQAVKTSREADTTVPKKKGEPRKNGRVRSRPEDLSSSLQRAQQEDELSEELIRNALEPCNVRREHFNRAGFVAVAHPPLQNPRLSSQRGVFLLNGAQDRTFEESLELMMRGEKRRWYRRFRIPEDALEKVEEKLFQFNIHDLSLFPDIEGLAGFVRQKVRLHW